MLDRSMVSRFGALAAGIVLANAALATPAIAVPITGLFNTGVDAAGNALPAGSNDPHYTIISPSQPAVTMNAHPAWVANAATHSWVWQSSSGQPTNVTLTFQTTFDLTGLDPTTASVSGQWATDNTGLDIFLNGVGTGNTCGGFASLCNFAVNSGFVAGVNTLDFQVNDFGVIAGFLVASINGTADVLQNGQVPEPGTLALFGLGLAGLGLAGRRRTA